MIKFFGIIDIIVAVFFMFNLFFKDFFPDRLLLIFAIILIIKGLVFLLALDFIISPLDIICGIIMILSLYIHIHPIISTIVIFFLLQKGFFSLVS